MTDKKPLEWYYQDDEPYEHDSICQCGYMLESTDCNPHTWEYICPSCGHRSTPYDDAENYDDNN